MEITFIIIIAQRDESTMTKCNLRPEQIKLYFAAKTTSALCMHANSW